MKGASSASGPTAEIRHPFLQFPIRPQEEIFQILRARPLETVVARSDDPGTIQFRLGSLVRQLNVPVFGTALGLYTEEFIEENELHTLNHHIHHFPSQRWNALTPKAASYNPSRSKASALPPSLRYLHAILVHTLTEGERALASSTLTIHTFYGDGGYLHWTLCDAVGSAHRAPQHSSPIILPHSHGLDVPTGHFEHAKTSSKLKVGDKVSLDAADPYIDTAKLNEEIPLTVLSIFPFGTVEVSHPKFGTFKEGDPEDIADGVPPRHEDPPSQPPPPSHPIHAAGSYADISECLTQFEQQFIKSSKAYITQELETPLGKVLHDLPCPARPRP
ncbi:hypothetical protein GOBAR_AA27790 [Gossypium barbadense]|uniref:Uncharacterized protein n=1 Tax=Gossypium barbadense TaxID=3634 RepID=A0A2P5WP82_GOSBA|nr:hypothetical protein GOBAR_AA27790 [Gossypium barbadense]